MSVKRDSAAVVGAGVAACAVCCAGPILGFLGAIGLGAAAGAAIFGAVSLVIGGAVAASFIVRRRRRRCRSGHGENCECEAVYGAVSGAPSAAASGHST
jgi:hypothetical protein